MTKCEKHGISANCSYCLTCMEQARAAEAEAVEKVIGWAKVTWRTIPNTTDDDAADEHARVLCNLKKACDELDARRAERVRLEGKT